VSAILERMIDKRPQADRILVAQLTGEARYRAKWRPLTDDEEAAALAGLRELAGGRADLLAEVAGILEGASGGEPRARQAAGLCRKAGPTRPRSRPGSRKRGAGGLPRGCHHPPAACTAGERFPRLLAGRCAYRRKASRDGLRPAAHPRRTARVLSQKTLRFP